jgi:hypothetical protein
MAALRTTSAGQLAKYVGATVETISNSMLKGGPVYRSGSTPSTVYVLNNQENKDTLEQFIRLGASGKSPLERQSYELQLICRNNKIITIGSVNKPTVRANLGDVAEGVFAAAIAARFIYKNQTISASQVYAVIASLRSSGSSTYPGKKGLQAEVIRQSPNAGISLQDDVRLFVSLAESNMRFLFDTVGNRGALNPYVLASVNYANSKTVRDWAELVYNNRRYDKIEIEADGLGGQRFTKVDVRVKITNDKGQLLPVNINVSLKAGDVKQFGQLGGTEFNDLLDFFNRLFGIANEIAPLSDKYEKMTKVDHKYSAGLQLIYKKVHNILSSKLDIRAKSNPLLDAMGRGIIYYATLNEENVQLVQLNNREAKVYQFENVGEKIKEYNYDVRYSESGEKLLPQLDIVNKSDGKLLLRIRVKGENKTDSKTGKSYTYYRNYVEKGNFLGDLIASYV